MATFASVTTAPVFAASSFSGGIIHLHGIIVDSSCTVDSNTTPSSYTKDVAMGAYTTSDFGLAGSLASSGAVDVSLELTDCPLEVTEVGVVLTSLEGEDTTLPSNFAIASGIGAADGVALQMQYGAGAPLLRGTQIPYGTETAPFPVNKGSATIAMQAQYIATQESSLMTSGKAENNVLVSLNYY
ncbi:type 1 fimbrial protein [Vibrio parahaemolyticus]|nr:type 1 fimbrial protein [Vibrio parahaemolyticus]